MSRYQPRRCISTNYGAISFRYDQTASSGFLHGNGSDGNGFGYAKQLPARVRTDRLRQKRDQISSPNVLVSGPFSTGLANVGDLRHIRPQVETEQRPHPVKEITAEAGQRLQTDHGRSQRTSEHSLCPGRIQMRSPCQVARYDQIDQEAVYSVMKHSCWLEIMHFQQLERDGAVQGYPLEHAIYSIGSVTGILASSQTWVV